MITPKETNSTVTAQPEAEKTWLEKVEIKTWIIVGASVFTVFVGGFIIYKCWKGCKNNKIKME